MVSTAIRLRKKEDSDFLVVPFLNNADGVAVVQGFDTRCVLRHYAIEREKYLLSDRSYKNLCYAHDYHHLLG